MPSLRSTGSLSGNTQKTEVEHGPTGGPATSPVLDSMEAVPVPRNDSNLGVFRFSLSSFITTLVLRCVLWLPGLDRTVRTVIQEYLSRPDMTRLHRSARLASYTQVIEARTCVDDDDSVSDVDTISTLSRDSMVSPLSL